MNVLLKNYPFNEFGDGREAHECTISKYPRVPLIKPSHCTRAGGRISGLKASHSISIRALNIHYRLGLLHFGNLWWISYVFWMITEMPYRKSYPLHLSPPSNPSFTESRLVKPDQTLSLNNWNWAFSGSSWNPVIKLAIWLSGKLFGVWFFFK